MSQQNGEEEDLRLALAFFGDQTDGLNICSFLLVRLLNSFFFPFSCLLEIKQCDHQAALQLIRTVPADTDEKVILKMDNVRQLFDAVVSLYVSGEFKNISEEDYRSFHQILNIRNFDNSYDVPRRHKGSLYSSLVISFSFIVTPLWFQCTERRKSCKQLKTHVSPSPSFFLASSLALLFSLLPSFVPFSLS
jgi:hypothetical protein